MPNRFGLAIEVLRFLAEITKELKLEIVLG